MLPLLDDVRPATAGAPAVGLRERKKRQAREAIVDAALELFADRGYDATTVAEVAARAGVSPATVARYFPTKESLLFPERELNTAALRAAILARPSRESPHAAVVAALTGAGRDPGEPMAPAARRRLLRSRRAIARSAVLRGSAIALLAVWRDTIATAVEERGTAPDEARVLATVVVAVLDDVADRWAAAGGTDDLNRAVGDAFAALDRAHRRTP